MKLATGFKVIGGILAVPLILAIAVLLYLAFGDLSIYKDDIAAAAAEASGLDVVIEGPIELRIGKKIALTLLGTTVTNPAWPDDALATAKELHVLIDTGSILRGPLQIDKLDVGGSIISLRENADGGKNWLPTAPENPDPAEEPGLEPLLHLAVAEGVRIEYRQEGAPAQTGTIQTLGLRRNNDGSFTFELGASYTQASGELEFGARGRLTRRDREIGLDDLALRAFGGEITGAVSMDFGNDRPSVTATISATELDLRFPDRDEALPAGDKEQPDSGDFIFSDAPLEITGLDALNVKLDAFIAKLVLEQDVLSDITISAALSEGLLDIGRFELKSGDGNLSGTLQLRPENGSHAMQLEATVRDFRVAALLAKDQDPATLPPLTASLALKGRGHSLHEIMSSSSGRLSGRQDSGQIDLQAASVLFSDFVTSILRTLNPLAESRQYTNLECGIYEIDIAEGIATIEEFAAQSDRLTIISSGDIDLNTEEVDVVLSTKSREGIGVSIGGIANSFLKLGGTLRDPSVGMDAAGSLTTTGAAVATGGLSVLAKGLWDRISAEADICARKPEPTD